RVWIWDWIWDMAVVFSWLGWAELGWNGAGAVSECPPGSASGDVCPRSSAAR
ncbi:MAG: hypothetical protein RLY71_4687, partial [Pseudomonadota bacterium]